MNLSPTAQAQLTLKFLRNDEGIEYFGRLIVRGCIHDWEFFDKAAHTVDYNANTGVWSENDFLPGEKGSIDGLVFTVMLDFRAHHIEGNPVPKGPVQWVQAIRPHLEDRFAMNPDWPVVYKERALRAVLLEYEPMRIGDYDRLYDGVVDYVRGMRQRSAAAKTANADPVTRQAVFDEAFRSVRVPNSAPLLLDATAHIMAFLQEKTLTHSFRTGVTRFDQMYGDHAAPGEAWLGASLPGGGKTVTACQIAGNTAAMGRKVLYIPTEEPPGRGLLRACAAQQRLSYAALQAIRGTGRLDATDSGEQLGTWLQSVGRNITVIDYAYVGGDTFEARMDSVMQAYERQHGTHPEMLIFDWVGKAVDLVCKDAWEKRELYSRVVNRVSDIGRKLGVVSWTFAQADKGIKNRTNIMASETADAKNLEDPMDGVMFMTALWNPDVEMEGNELKDPYKPHQYWVVPKCRSRQTSVIPVTRKFEQQRFADYMM